MPLVETESLVLKTYNLAEADRIVLFLTQEHGLVRGVAKGAKRLKSKFGSGLEPYSVVKLSYFQKDAVELVSIQQVELLHSYFSFAAQPEVLQTFAYLSDLLTAITPPNDPNADLYRMVKACLEASAELPNQLERAALYFEIWLLRLGGYLPDWSRCSLCKRTLATGEKAALQANYQAACSDCRKVQSGTVVSGPMRDLLALAQRQAPIGFLRSDTNDLDEIGQTAEILRRIFSTAIGRDLVTGKSLVW